MIRVVSRICLRHGIKLLKATKNQTATADLLRISVNKVGRIMRHSVATWDGATWSSSTVEHLSIDEKAIKKGHHYATILSDATTGCVLDLGQGRGYKETEARTQVAGKYLYL